MDTKKIYRWAINLAAEASTCIFFSRQEQANQDDASAPGWECSRDRAMNNISSAPRRRDVQRGSRALLQDDRERVVSLSWSF